jgi:acetyl esterase
MMFPFPENNLTDASSAFPLGTIKLGWRNRDVSKTSFSLLEPMIPTTGASFTLAKAKRSSRVKDHSNKTGHPLNPQMKEILDQFEKFGAPAIPTLNPDMARQVPELREAFTHVLSHHALRRLSPDSMVESVAQVDHHVVAGGLLVRTYRPAGDGPFPIIVYFHGGGWVIGSLNSYDASCRALANSADAIVVSVAYRQAPEHPYPAARNDALRAYLWTMDLARSIGGDPGRIAVAGESAGGNLAAVVCLMARDQGLRMPLHQLLIYPVTQFGFETESYLEQAQAKPLDRAMMKYFWKHYLANGANAKDPYHSPLLAESFSGLPPATILTAEFDPLRSEGEAYADALQEAGIPVFQRRYNGVGHEFFGFSNYISEAKQAREDAAEQLRVAFDTALFEREKIRTTIYTRQPGMAPDRSPGY